jgi:alkylated DNA repair dioxygenase AlkB
VVLLFKGLTQKHGGIGFLGFVARWYSNRIMPSNDCFREAAPEIDGLRYLPNYVDAEAAERLIAAVDASPWIEELRRRVQHYGWRYDYKRRVVDASLYLGPLPEWAQELAERLHRDGLTEAVPDQLIVNEYEPGQGIAAHVDCVPCFGPTILSLSLGSSCQMDFTQPETGTKKSLLLEGGSLLVLQRDARYQWQHGIPARKSDTASGGKSLRSRRVSLTFRCAIVTPVAE